MGLTYFRGLNDREADHVWTKELSEITIHDKAISEYGLELRYLVPNELFLVTSAPKVDIYVNGILVVSQQYQQAWNGSVILTPDQLPYTEDGVYTIRIQCNSHFIPSEVLGTTDGRELALALFYIGRPH